MNRGRLLPIIAAAALLAAACGDSDDAEDVADTTVEAGGSTEPAMGPAELTVEAQSGDGATVTVASVTLPSGGFIAIHADNAGAPGPVIGHSDALDAGESTDVEVTLDEPLAADATVWPMAHIDTNANGEYDFDPPDSTEDGPATFDDGEVAVLPLEYTVEGGGGTGGSDDADDADPDGADDSDDASAAGDSVTIVDFAFDPASIEVAAGSTVTWTNDDGVQHTVTAGEPDGEIGDFNEPIDADASVEVTFDEAGTFAYYCAIHPSMIGEVVVS